MSTPAKITFEIGQDKYGRALQLLRFKDATGAITWSMKRAAAGQRDDVAAIDDIPDDVMRRILNTVATPQHYL